MHNSITFKMKRVLYLILIVLSLVQYQDIHAQCTPASADNCEDANVLCSLSEVNGYTCMNTDYSNPTGCSPLCPSGGGAHNTGWWAFVTNGGNVCITLTFANCTVNGTGVQFGIWGDCNCGESVFCDPSCSGPGSKTACGNLTACKTYYLFVDGCTGDVCDFTITTSGGGPPVLPPLGNLSGPLTLCKGACNVKYKIDLLGGGGCEPSWQWTLDGVELDQYTQEITLDFPDEGDFVLCATAIIGNPQSGSICDQEGPKCITIKVRQEKDRKDGPRHVCFENAPFVWHGQTISASGEYSSHFTDKNCCEYDSVVTFDVREKPEPPTVYYLGCIGDQYKDPTTGKTFGNCQNGTEIFLTKSTDPYKCDSAYNLVAAFINGTGRLREYCQGGMILLEVTPIDRTCFDGGYLTESFVYKWYLKNDPSKKSIGPPDEYIEITKKDDYCVEITFNGRLDKLTKSCKFDVCEQFNEDDFKYKDICPKGDLALCLNRIGKYSVDTLFPADARHIWTVSGGKLLTPNPIDKTQIEVLWDFDPFPAKQYNGMVCYHMESSCPPTEDCCIDVIIKVAPKPFAGFDDKICALDYKLRGMADVGGGSWTQISGPPATINPPGSPNPDVTSSAYGKGVFVFTESSLGCTTSDTVEINFNENPNKGPITYICGSSNKDFVATFQINPGKAPFTVIRGNGAVDPTGVYTSNTIQNLTDEIIEIEDANGCRFLFTINYECKCTNDIGVMDKNTKELCQDKCLDIYSDSLYDNRNQKLDVTPRDTLIFFVCTDPNNPNGSLLYNLRSTNVCFDASRMQFGTTYYVGAKIGRANGRGDIDAVKGCVRVDVGTPITWFEIPRPDAGPDRAICGAAADLQGTKSVSSSKGSWREVNGKGVNFFDITDPTTPVDVLAGPGVYTFEYVEDNNNGLCVGTDRVTITFNPNPVTENPDKVCLNLLGGIFTTDYRYLVTMDITTGTPPYSLVIPPSSANGRIVGNKYVSDSLNSLDNFIVVVRDANGCESILYSDQHNCDCGIIFAGELDTNLTRVCEDKCVPIKSLLPEIIDPEDVAMYVLHKSSYNSTIPGVVLDTFYSKNDMICFDPKTMKYGDANPVYITRVVGDDVAPNDKIVDSKDPCKRASNNMKIIFEPYASPDAGPDEKICGLDYTFKGVLSFGNASWRQLSGPSGGIANINNPTNELSTVTVNTIGTYRFILQGDNFGCIGLDTVSITFVDAPEFIDPTYSYECDNVAENYRIKITARNGERLSWQLIGKYDNASIDLPGQYVVTNGSEWQSDWIPTGLNFDLSIKDANDCNIDLFTGREVCPCITLPGTVATIPTDLCQSACTQATYNGGARDANDVVRFVIYEANPADPTNPSVASKVLSFNDNGRFCFDNVSMNLGTTYYIAAYVGNLDPKTGNVLITDRCTRFTSGVPVTWYDDPKSIITGPNLLTCKDSVLVLSGATSVSASGDQLTYLWKPGNTTTSTLTITTPGTYTLDVVDPRAGCTNSVTFVVTQDIKKPNVVIDPPQELTCARTIIDLNGDKSDKGSIYSPSWTGGVRSGSSNHIATTDKVGDYILTVVNTFNGCKDSRTVTVTEDVVPPTADVRALGQLTCTVNQIQLDGTGSRANSGPGLTYTWIGSIISGQGTATATVGKPGGFYVLEVKDSKNGCISRDSIPVVEIGNPLDAVISDPRNPLCYGDRNGEIIVNEVRDKSGNVLSGPFTYSINGGPYTANNRFANLSQGVYTISVKDANGCLVSEKETLIEPGKLGIDVIKTIVVDQGTEVNLDSLLLALYGGTANASGQYKDTTWFNLDEKVDWKRRKKYLADTTREFLITGIDQSGCQISDRVRVLVRIIKEVWWPNVINPQSGTTENQFFNLYGKRVRSINVLNVYDRWGELVYSGENLVDGSKSNGLGWNGNFLGQKALPGVYVFYAEVQYEGSASTDKFKGEFTLLR